MCRTIHPAKAEDIEAAGGAGGGVAEATAGQRRDQGERLGRAWHHAYDGDLVDLDAPAAPGADPSGVDASADAGGANETLRGLGERRGPRHDPGQSADLADERTNQLLIITRAENMAFFDRIITVLDIETLPDVKVEVMPSGVRRRGRGLHDAERPDRQRHVQEG